MKETFSLLDFFTMGGPVMWPLALFSVMVLAVTLERLVFFLSRDFRTHDLAGRICENPSSGLSVLNNEKSRRFCIPAFRAVLEDNNLDAAEKKCSAVASALAEQTYRNLTFLSALATIAPVTGFLGTVTGMISAFMAIAQADSISAGLAATGIFQALITTAFGLFIAVAATVSYHIFSAVSDRFAASLENSCNLILAARNENKSKE